MRLAIASLIAFAASAATAQGQTAAPAAQVPPTPAPPAPAAPATAPAPSPVPQTTTPATPPPSTGVAPPAPPEAAPPPPPAAEAPPAPPPPTKVPTAIVLLSTLESVCVPAVEGGSMAALTKAAGYRKSGPNYLYKGRGFQLTVEDPGSNPTQCHVDLIHPVDPEAPAKPLVIALHNWAAISRDYTLYRNDKNVQGANEYTTRSWEHTADGKHEALVLTTIRKADGSPSRRDADTSEMIYSETPAS
ncbi:MAG: hypothetical protein ACYC8V_10980 [Caulobacteraceae bacterium]